MGNKRRYQSALVLAGLLFSLSAGLCKAPGPEYPETRQLVSRVEKAAALVRARGERAFEAFRKKESEWYRGDSYIFVGDMNGVEVCHPAQPELEGKNLLDLKDANGKAVTRSFLHALSGKSRSGWVHYVWPKPGHNEPVWKTTYLVRVTAPSGKEYFVGSGIYATRTDRMFAVMAVDDAVRLLQQRGAAGFPELRDKSGDFLFADVYVFVLDQRGKALVHPASPDLEGRNLMELKDANGRRFIAEMVRVVQTHGSGWVDYLWPKPGATLPSRKSSYIRKVTMAGDTLLVGAGVYLD